MLTHDGFGKHAEFRGTMPGHNHPWRPAVLLILTLPVALPPIAVSPLVTTRITEYTLSTVAGEVEMWAEIATPIA